jgi:HEAT repeat protein
MVYLTRYRKVFGFILFSILLLFGESATKATKIPIDLAQELQRNGYPSDTQEQIIEATKSESYYVRHIALELLTQRTGNKAIPTLKNALSDPRFEVRERAAHLLGTLDDKSGLEQMRKDLKELAPDNGAPLPPNPNVKDPNKIKEREGKRNLRLYNAIRAARVLAELGDRQGYELAKRLALQGPWRQQRFEAIVVLVDIAKTDKAILEAEGIDPVSTLSKIAEFEKQPTVFQTLTNLVARNLDDESAIRILEIAKNSQNQSEEVRHIAQTHLDTVKARKKTGGFQRKDPNNCGDK